MAIEPDGTLARRIVEWFTDHEGKMVMIDIGTHRAGRDPREWSFLTYTTQLGRNYNSDAFDDPGVIVVNIPDEPGGSILTVPPSRVADAKFDEHGTNSLAIYFEDAGYVSLLAIG